MKKIIILLISIIGLGLIYSCEEDQVGPTLNLSEASAPTITSPEDGFSLVLIKDEADSSFTIEWTKADYKMEDIPDIRYNLEMTYLTEGTSVTLAATTSLSASITYQNLNYRLFDFGLEPDQEGEFTLQVVASISETSTDDNLSSAPITVSLTPFDDEPEPTKPIYLLGSATEPGWSNTDALEMTHIEDGVYEIIATLTAGSGQFIKFISILGQWAPQWGTDDTGTWEEGPLIYRPTEDVPDPDAIPAPPEDGDFLIVADTANLVYSVTPITDELYLFGNATEVGMDISNALPMIMVSPMRFEVNTYLKGGEKYSFGFTLKRNNKSLQYRISDEGRLMCVPSSSAENLIAAPNDGNYLIEVDLLNRRYKLTKQ